MSHPGPAARPWFELRGLRVRYGARVAVAGLDLDLAAGEAVGLLGPNGSGKSTALKALAGLLPAEAGRLSLDGQQHPLGGGVLRAQLGMVFQSPSLDGTLDLRTNLELSLQMQGVARREARRRAPELLAFAGLADRSRDRVRTLSGGLKRRLDLARAVGHGPRVLFLDEPTTGLDESAYAATWDRIDQARQTIGVSALVATHRADEAARCDRLVVLNAGEVVARATPAELIRQATGQRGDVVALTPAVATGSTRADALDAMQRDLERWSASSSAVTRGLRRIERRPDSVAVVAEDGHALVVALVEALGAGRLLSVQVRRPSLADAFVALTGRGLGDDTAAPDTWEAAA